MYTISAETLVGDEVVDVDAQELTVLGEESQDTLRYGFLILAIMMAGLLSLHIYRKRTLGSPVEWTLHQTDHATVLAQNDDDAEPKVREVGTISIMKDVLDLPKEGKEDEFPKV